MKKLFLFIVTMAVLSVFADGIKIVIRCQNGKGFYVEKDSVDSVFFVRGCLPEGKIQRIGVHDTLCLHDTLNIIDTLTFTDTLTEYVYVPGLVSTDKWNVNVENPVVADYMNEVDYSDDLDNYTYSKIKDYGYIFTDYRKDQPRGIRLSWKSPGTNQKVILRWDDMTDTVSIQDGESSVDIYNLVPGKRYEYTVSVGADTVKSSHFATQGLVRMMYLPSLHNVRDLGGWKTTDGKRIKYDRIFRGGEMNDYYDIKNCSDVTHHISSADSLYMHDVMNIRLDMDLRDGRDMNLYDTIQGNNRNHTELGADVEYYNEMVNYNPGYFEKNGYNYNKRWGRTLSRIIKHLENGDNIYIHCIWGADRTGILAMLIEGLLGVPEEDLTKDFELTNMSYGGRTRLTSYWGADLTYLKSLAGETLKDKIETYFLKAGVTQEDIDTLREIMLE